MAWWLVLLRNSSFVSWCLLGFFFGYANSLPQSKNMHIMLVGDPKWTTGVSVERVWLFLKCSPAIEWWNVHGVPRQLGWAPAESHDTEQNEAAIENEWIDGYLQLIHLKEVTSCRFDMPEKSSFNFCSIKIVERKPKNQMRKNTCEWQLYMKLCFRSLV